MTFDRRHDLRLSIREPGPTPRMRNGNPIVVNGVAQTVPNPATRRSNWPSRRQLPYAHYQFDTQASYKLPWGIEVYGYGLEPEQRSFGFYNGKYAICCSARVLPSHICGGIRWTPRLESRPASGRSGPLWTPAHLRFRLRQAGYGFLPLVCFFAGFRARGMRRPQPSWSGPCSPPFFR